MLPIYTIQHGMVVLFRFHRRILTFSRSVLTNGAGHATKATLIIPFFFYFFFQQSYNLIIR